jgi:hypothetical protein
VFSREETSRSVYALTTIIPFDNYGSLSYKYKTLSALLVLNSTTGVQCEWSYANVGRLSLYSHKRLKFLMFAICSAREELFAELRGPPIQETAQPVS